MVKFNEDIDGYKYADVSVSDIKLSDGGSYYCELGFTLADSPIPIVSTKSSNLKIQYPPASLNLEQNLAQDGIIEISCSTEKADPPAEIKLIGGNSNAIVSEESIDNGKLFKYALSPADNNQVITVGNMTGNLNPFT